MIDFEAETVTGLAEVLHIRRARRFTMIIVGVAMLVVATLTVSLLSIKTVTFNITPARAAEDSTLNSIEGFSIALGRSAHFFGAVEIEVAAEGFFPKSVAINRSTESPLIVELEPQPGVVSIELNFLRDESRNEYSLLADGTQLFDPVPTSIELPAGNYELRLQGPQEYDSTQFVEIQGYGSKQVVSFEALPRGSFSVSVVPDTANIKLNGTWVATGQLQKTVVAKSHVLDFESEGFLAKRLPFTVDANSHVDLGTVNLTSAPGIVKLVSSPESASIFVDGKFVGSTPAELEISKSRIQVELRKPNFHSAQATLNVPHGDTVTQEFTLKAVRFDVQVSAEPPASLIVNDDDRRSTPTTVNVTAGDILEVFKEGYVSQSITIEPEEHQKRQVHVVLVDIAQHAYDIAPHVISVQDTIRLKKFPSAKFHLRVPRYLMEDDRERSRQFEISRPFYFGIHEIRRKEYVKFDSSVKTTTSDENLPITDISWLDAIKFCNWLSQSEGLDPVYSIGSGASVSVDFESNGYRLPTEAEWELITYYHFADQKAVGPFAWGEGTKPPTRIGNLAGFETRSALRSYITNYGDSHKDLAPVGSYRPNFNGIHDLTGNAAEWVFDYFGTHYEGWDKPLTDPMGPRRGIDRIAKGANFQTIKLHEAAINFRRTVGYKDEAVGFRIARWVL